MGKDRGFGNRYPGTCWKCRATVAAMAGFVTRSPDGKGWRVAHKGECWAGVQRMRQDQAAKQDRKEAKAKRRGQPSTMPEGRAYHTLEAARARSGGAPGEPPPW